RRLADYQAARADQYRAELVERIRVGAMIEQQVWEVAEDAAADVGGGLAQLENRVGGRHPFPASGSAHRPYAVKEAQAVQGLDRHRPAEVRCRRPQIDEVARLESGVERRGEQQNPEASQVAG